MLHDHLSHQVLTVCPCLFISRYRLYWGDRDNWSPNNIANQGIINICAKIEEVGTTTHDEWYGDLRDTGPTFDEWYKHDVAPKIHESNKETRRGVMDGTIPSAVVDTGVTSSVGKYGAASSSQGSHPTRFSRWQQGRKPAPPKR